MNMRLFTLLLTTGYVVSTIHALRPAGGGSRLWTSSSLSSSPRQRMPFINKHGGSWNVNTKHASPPSNAAAAAALAAATSVSGGATEKTEEWTKKRLHNTATFRSVALLAVLAASGASSSNAPLSLIPTKAAASIHLLSFSTWFGTVAYTTFVAGITMFQNLPRQTFGKLQAKLFPKYFALCSATIVLQLVTLKSLSMVAKASSSKTALGVALVMTLLNQFYLEPLSTNNMMERYRLDDIPGGKDTDKYKKLKSSFGKFHGMSSLANLVALCAGVAHGVYLASALV